MPEISDEELQRYKAAEAEKDRLAKEKADLETAYRTDMGRLSEYAEQNLRRPEPEPEKEPDVDDDLFVANPRKAVQRVRDEAREVFAKESAPAVRALTESAVDSKLQMLVSQGRLKPEWAKEVKERLKPMLGNPQAASEEVIGSVVTFIRGKHEDELRKEWEAEHETKRKAKQLETEEDEGEERPDAGEEDETERQPPARRERAARSESPVAVSTGVHPGARGAKKRERLTEDERFIAEQFGIESAEDYRTYENPNYDADLWGGKGRKRY